MAEPEAKKQKFRQLTCDWFLTQIEDLELSDDQKTNVSKTLARVPENDLRKATPDMLMFYMGGDCVEEDSVRRIVAGRVHHQIAASLSAAPASRVAM